MKRIKSYAVACALLAGSAQTLSGCTYTIEEGTNSVDAYFAQPCSTQHVDGNETLERNDLQVIADAALLPAITAGYAQSAVVGIVTDQGRYFFGYGATSKSNDACPNRNSQVELASITKTFTGLLLAHEVQKGTLDLNLPVSHYLPHVMPKFHSMPGMPGNVDSEFSLLNLATHSSGLPKMPENWTENYAWNDFWAYLAGYTLPYAPGQTYNYSNQGVAIEGAAIEQAVGKPWADQIQDVITGPLWMPRTHLGFSDAEKATHLTSYYADGSPLNNDWTWIFATAGSLQSTPDDMLTYLAANAGIGVSTPLSSDMKFEQTPRMNYSADLALGLNWHISPPSGTYSHGGAGAALSGAYFNTTARFGMFIAIYPILQADGTNTLAGTALNTASANLLTYLQSQPTPVMANQGHSGRPATQGVPDLTGEWAVKTVPAAQ